MRQNLPGIVIMLLSWFLSCAGLAFLSPQTDPIALLMAGAIVGLVIMFPLTLILAVIWQLLSALCFAIKLLRRIDPYQQFLRRQRK